MSKSYRSIIGSSLAAALLWLASTGSADAILVRGSIDPVFGTSGTLSGLYWTADVSFNVDGSCLAAATEDILCSISGLTATGTVNDGTDGVMNVNYLATPSSPPTQMDLAVDANQQVIGIGSAAIGFGTVGLPALQTVANLWVQFFLPVFNTDGVITTPSQGELIATTCSTTIPTVEPSVVCTPAGDPAAGMTSVPASVVITQVPEPSSLVLMLVALLTGWPLLRPRHSSC